MRVGVVVVVVIIVGIEELFVVFAGLYLAAIAFFAEGEVEVVAFKANPVLIRVFRWTRDRVKMVD